MKQRKQLQLSKRPGTGGSTLSRRLAYMLLLLVTFFAGGGSSAWAETETIQAGSSAAQAAFSYSNLTAYSYGSNNWTKTSSVISIAKNSNFTFTNVNGVTITGITIKGVADNNASKGSTITITDNAATPNSINTGNVEWAARTAVDPTSQSLTGINALKMTAGTVYTVSNSDGYALGIQIEITYTTEGGGATVTPPAIPTFNPDGGNYDGNLSVTLSSSDAESFIYKFGGKDYSKEELLNSANNPSTATGSSATVTSNNQTADRHLSAIAVKTVNGEKYYSDVKTATYTYVAPVIPTYTITYNLNGHGDAIADVTNATALPATLPTPTATGYEFGGWYTNEGLTDAAVAGTEISANTTLYAKWTQTPILSSACELTSVKYNGTNATSVDGNTYNFTIAYEDNGQAEADGKKYYDFSFTISDKATCTVGGENQTPNAGGVYVQRKSLGTNATDRNSFTVVVTAEDGTTTAEYVINLVRGAAPAIDGQVVWDYTTDLPSKSPNNNLYYTQGTATDDNGQGIKVNGSAGIYFTKTGAGTLTLVYGARKVGKSISLNVYNNTSNQSSLASDAQLVKTTQLSTPAGLTIEAIELSASQNNVYINRAGGAEGIITKLIWTPNGTAHAINASATNGSVTLKSGDYSVISGAKVPANTAVVATATPTDESYNFEGWTVNGNTSNATQTLNVTMDKDYIIVATFNKIEQQVSNLTKVNNNAIAFTYNDGQTYTLAKTTDYTTSSNGAITFTTSDATVATVDAEGKITPNNAGTATITLTQAETPEYKGSSVQFTVTVAAIEPTITVTDYIKHFTGQTIRTNLVSNSDGAFTITVASNSEKVKSEIDGRTLVTTGVSEDNQSTSVTITQAASGNYSEKAFTITLDCFAAPTVITEVLEVRGNSSVANGTFTNSTNTHDLKFTDSSQVSDGTDISDKSELTGKVYRSPNANAITIVLNSTSAKEIVIGAKANSGSGAPFTSITVDGVTTPVANLTTSGGITNKDKVYKLTISNLNIDRGSVVKLTFSEALSFYYFEVTSKAEVYAPVITDNGNATGSMTSKTNGVSYKYKALTEKLTTLPTFSSDDDSWKESTTGAITDLSTTNEKYYIYAVAIKNSKVSDVAEGIIAVETIPSLSCKPVAVTLNSDQSQTQAITTVATMNKQTVTGNYTYVYTSDKESVATVDGAGLITAVGPGSAKITISAKDNSDNVVATDEVIVVVTKDGLITPEFTWNGTQFDVVVNKTFNEKTPVAYNSVIRGDDTRYLDITNGYDITYFSSNGNATITNKGVVTGKALGQATITAVFTPNKEYQGSYNGGMATIIANVKEGGATPLTVEVANNPSVIDLSSDALTYQSAQPTSVKAGDVQLSSGKWFATYESDNWNVATVNETGLVTAKNVGTATIRIAYMPAQDGIYAKDYNACTKEYTITVVDPTRFVVEKGYGADGSVKPLTTITDNNKYVTMTFGGWMGVDASEETSPSGDYWGGEKDAAKSDAAGANPDFPYAITAKSSGNPTSEAVENYAPGTATQFSVPCRGAYLQFEPAVDGTIEVNILQNGVLNNDDSKNPYKASTGRLVYIVDEFGAVVTPNAYGMTANVKNPGVSDSEYKQSVWETAVKGIGLDVSYIDGDHGKGKVEEIILYNQGYAVLTKGPTYYEFDVKAGKKYYVFGNGTKNGFYGFQFRKDNDFSATSISIDTESGETVVNDGQDDKTMNQAQTEFNGKSVVIDQYDRNFTAGIWTPLVLPYSMNDIQVKSIFGDGVEILYVDDVKGSTIKMSHHFYKTIVAGKSCLIKPSKDVTSLATTGIEKDGVAYPYVTFSNVDITGYSDYTTGKDGAGYIWSASYEPQNVNGGDYYISTKDGNFTRLAAGKTAKLKGCRAFLKVVEPATAKALTVDINGFEDEDGSATGIIGVIVDEDGSMDVVMKNDKIYDLSGRAINSESMIKGNIYIHNGKKFIAQ